MTTPREYIQSIIIALTELQNTTDDDLEPLTEELKEVDNQMWSIRDSI